MFASKTQKTIDIPQRFNDEGDPQQHAVTLRRLSPKSLDAAAKESQRKAMLDLTALGGAKVIREFQSETPKSDEKPGAANPLLLFDHWTLIQKSVVSWTLLEKVTEESIADFDAAEWLAGEILRLSRPELFQSEDEKKDAQVKG